MEERIYETRLTEIEPLCILRLILHKFYLVVLAALIGIMGASIVLSVIISHDYVSSATFVVTARAGSGSYYSDISAASETAAICSELLQSDVMRDAIQDSLGKTINGNIVAQQQGETNLITVTVTSPSPKDALLIMQAIIDNYAQLSDYVSSTAVLSMLNAPSVVTSAHSFDVNRIAILSGMACAVIMMALLSWMSVAANTIQTPEGAQAKLDAQIIGTVPHEKTAITLKRKGARKHGDLNINSPTVSFAFTESIHRIAAKFEHERSKGQRVFMFSSVSEAEGKSTLAANIALSLAARHLRVLFIDLDLRRPVQSKILSLAVDNKHELGDLLLSDTTADEILKATVEDPSTGLHSLLSTKSYVDMIELIASPLLAQVISLARERYDLVIIDSPPLGYFADSELLSDLSDCSVLAVRQDIVPAPIINDAIDALRAGKAEFLGCILNDMRYLQKHVSSYGYGKYGYGKYGYGQKQSHVTAESEVPNGKR